MAVPTPTDRIVIKVEQVDLANRTVHGLDKTKSSIMASIRDTGAAFRVPSNGELWTVCRYGYVWYLEQRLDDPDDHDALQVYQPGDTRLHAGGTLHMQVEAATINDLPVGATVYDAFVADGLEDTFVLSAEPVHDRTLQAFLNGVLQATSLYSVNGTNVSFVSAPSAGTLIIYYQRT